MPTYDYICKECEHTWEVFQKMSDSPKRKCPKCGRHRAKRLIGVGAGLIFKGSGFYVTDYKKNGLGAASSTESNNSAESSNSSDSADSGESSTSSDSSTSSKSTDSKSKTSDKSGNDNSKSK